MRALAATYAVLLAAAACVFVAGLSARVVAWLRTPQPWRVPTTPAPMTRIGVAWRLAREALLFESLFKATRTTWLLGWPFHLALLLVLAGHLRFFTREWWTWLPATHALAPWVGALMLATVGGLWARRLLVARVRHVSTPADHLMLALLAGIAASGLAIGAAPAPVAEGVRLYVRGLFALQLRPLPAQPAVLLHLALVAVLLAVFPFSKLLHGPGLFLAPTRYQTDHTRLRREG